MPSPGTTRTTHPANTQVSCRRLSGPQFGDLVGSFGGSHAAQCGRAGPGLYLVLLYAQLRNAGKRRPRFVIQQFMMRLSCNLRRFRWAVFAAWLLLLVPSVYLALTESGNLSGGGFEVAGSQ